MNLLEAEEAVAQEVWNEASELSERYRIPIVMIGSEYRSAAGRLPSWTVQFEDDIHVKVDLNWNEQKPLYVGVGSGPIQMREAKKAEKFAHMYAKATYVACALKRHLNRFLITYSVMEA